MYKSWGKLKNQLEKEFLCESLKGRIHFFYTVYRKTHDGIEGRFAISLDNEEVFKVNSFDRHKYWTLEKDLHEEFNLEWKDAINFVKDIRKKNFEYSTEDVFNSMRFCLSMPIKASFNSDDYLVKMFAILDRRVGKRTLNKLKDEIMEQPEWLQYFYKLRLDAENIAYK